MMTSQRSASAQASTCQICGRPIKSNTGVIAHHGYKRPGNGWQTSSCMGARHLAYELSCDMIPTAIQSIEDFISSANAALKELVTNPPAVLLREVYSGARNKVTYKEVPRPEGFSVDGDNYISRHSDYSAYFRAQRRDVETKIRFAESDLAYLRERLANWKAPVVVVLAVSAE